MKKTYFAAANDEDFLAFDLPGEDQAASTLYFWEFFLLTHDCAVASKVTDTSRDASA